MSLFTEPDSILAINNGLIPDHYNLSVPYPNPFNPITNIDYSTPLANYVSIIIYDIMGRQVEILYNGIQYQGNYTISWDASNYSSGVYFIKMNVGDSQSPIFSKSKSGIVEVITVQFYILLQLLSPFIIQILCNF